MDNIFFHSGLTVLCAVLGLALALGATALIASLRWKRLASSQPRVLLTGGGTGGHVNPALAIAEGIRKREPDTRFLYVGVRGKAETVIVRRAGYRLLFVASEGFPGLRPSFRTARFLIKLSVGIIQSIGILFWFAPRWIIATGGYVSAPIIAAALILKAMRLSRVQVFLHEQNSIPGQLNALLGRWVDRVLLTFPQTHSFFPGNGVVVGYPIRDSITFKSREEASANLPFQIPAGRKVVFAFGGSQGARTINRAVVDALPHLLPFRERILIIHGTGLSKSAEYDSEADTEFCLQNTLTPEQLALLDGFYYRQVYFHNIADVYSVSDLIVCRSGAGSLNEISRLGKPAILIPKANLPGDHQVMNARAMKHGGAAEILFEDTVVENGQVLEKVDGKFFATRILRLLENPGRLEQMAAGSGQFLRRQAVDRIVSEVFRDRAFDNGAGYQPVPFKPLMTNNRLLTLLSAAYTRNPSAYDPQSVVGDEDDLIYYRHRAAGLLSHKPWQERNIGVKLIGLTRYEEKIPTLLHMLADRTPVSPVKRLFGGDFEQVGFIRRNIVQALQVLNRWSPEVEEHLLAALEDPYFEVRVQACTTAAHFGTHIAGKSIWHMAVIERLKDPCFEVAVAAAEALGEIGVNGETLETLMGLQESHYWQVRDAALKALRRLLERRIMPPSPALLSQVNHFVLTATDFRPHFSIKETYKTLQQACTEKSAVKVEPEAPAAPAIRVSRKS